MSLYTGTNIITEERAIEIVKQLDNPTIYNTSENSYQNQNLLIGINKIS
ncbi:hypothetical protein [Okeania sp. SIO2C9]|nr:hypothetical protein [Okeania sp. SIO2C9]